MACTIASPAAKPAITRCRTRVQLPVGSVWLLTRLAGIIRSPFVRSLGLTRNRGSIFVERKRPANVVDLVAPDVSGCRCIESHFNAPDLRARAQVLLLFCTVSGIVSFTRW